MIVKERDSDSKGGGWKCNNKGSSGFLGQDMTTEVLAWRAWVYSTSVWGHTENAWERLRQIDRAQSLSRFFRDSNDCVLCPWKPQAIALRLVLLHRHFCPEAKCLWLWNGPQSHPLKAKKPPWSGLEPVSMTPLHGLLHYNQLNSHGCAHSHHWHSLVGLVPSFLFFFLIKPFITDTRRTLVQGYLCFFFFL